MASNVHIGISGWSYDEWKDNFYKNVPRSRWLEHYAAHFGTLEIDATFYRLQSEGTLKSWANRTPDHFVFSARGHRFVTHTKRLQEASETVPRARDNLKPLGKKLQVVLWQMPATFEKDLERLDSFAGVLNDQWTSVRHAIELTHPSWMDDEVAELLANYGLAACQSDAPDFRLWDVVTADFVYARLYGRNRRDSPNYNSKALDAWAEKIRSWKAEGRDGYVYFENTAEGAAPFDAFKLAERLDDPQKRRADRSASP